MSSNRKLDEQKFVVVSQRSAKQTPYPYVYVREDGTVRELGPGERTFLEEPFLPMDGGRPAIKESFNSKNGWGSIRGFCRRSLIPKGVEILPADAPLPSEDGRPQISGAENPAAGADE